MSKVLEGVTAADAIAEALMGEAGEGGEVGEVATPVKAGVETVPDTETPIETPAETPTETPVETPAVLAPAPGRAFSVSDSEGNAVEDLESITLKQLLDGEASIAYKAKGEEQKASLDKLVSMAQRQPGERQRLEQERTDHRATHKALTKALEGADASTAQKALLLKILKDSTGEEFRKAVAEFTGEEPGEVTVPSPATPAPAGVETPAADPYDPNNPNMIAGAGVVKDIIMPRAEALAEAFDADPQEVMQAIVQMAGEVVPGTLTVDRLGEIMNEGVVRVLTESGYEAGETVPDWTAPDVPTGTTHGLTRKGERPVTGDAALVKENATLKAQLAAATAGESIQAASDSPPAPEGEGGLGGTDTGEFNLDNAKSMDDVRKSLDALVE